MYQWISVAVNNIIECGDKIYGENSLWACVMFFFIMKINLFKNA